MAAKRKQRKFRAAKVVKAVARERLGTPPPGRPIPDKRKKKEEKHKRNLLNEAGR